MLLFWDILYILRLVSPLKGFLEDLADKNLFFQNR
jgi:hypothetical protein